MILKKSARHVFSVLASFGILSRPFQFGVGGQGHRAFLASVLTFPLLNFLNFLKKLPNPTFVSDHFCLLSDLSLALFSTWPSGHG